MGDSESLNLGEKVISEEAQSQIAIEQKRQEKHDFTITTTVQYSLVDLENRKKVIQNEIDNINSCLDKYNAEIADIDSKMAEIGG